MGPRSVPKNSDGFKNPDDQDYVKKRERNNVAVRRSREKSRQKQKETLEKVNRLRSENEDLEMKVKLLSKELSVLRDLFLEHAGVKHTVGTNDAETSGGVKQELDIKGEEEEEEQCPVNAIAAKMDHEYSTKPFSNS